MLPTAPSEPGSRPPARPQWTAFVYMAADNNLNDAGIDDLNEMEKKAEILFNENDQIAEVIVLVD